MWMHLLKRSLFVWLVLLFLGLSINSGIAGEYVTGCRNIRLQVTNDAVYLKAKCQYGFAWLFSQEDKIDLNKHIGYSYEERSLKFMKGGGLMDDCNQISLSNVKPNIDAYAFKATLDAKCFKSRLIKKDPHFPAYLRRDASIRLTIDVDTFSGDFELVH